MRFSAEIMNDICKCFFVILFLSFAVLLRAADGLTLYDVSGGNVNLQNAWQQMLKDEKKLDAASEISVKYSDSSVLPQLDEKSVAIVSEDVKVDEKRFVRELCAWLPVVVAVPDKCVPDNLSLSELQRVYCGRIASWSRLGGDEKKIYAAGYPADSPVSRAFVQRVMHQSGSSRSSLDILPEMLEVNSFAGCLAVLKAIPGVVVFGSRELANSASAGYKILKINNVAPEEKNVVSGAYPLVARIYMVYPVKSSPETIRQLKMFFRNVVAADKYLLLPGEK